MHTWEKLGIPDPEPGCNPNRVMFFRVFFLPVTLSSLTQLTLSKVSGAQPYPVPLPQTPYPYSITPYPVPLPHHPYPITPYPVPLPHHPIPCTLTPSPRTLYPYPIPHQYIPVPRAQPCGPCFAAPHAYPLHVSLHLISPHPLPSTVRYGFVT